MEVQFDVPAKSSKVSDNLTSSDSYYWFNGKQELFIKYPNTHLLLRKRHQLRILMLLSQDQAAVLRKWNIIDTLSLRKHFA